MNAAALAERASAERISDPVKEALAVGVVIAALGVGLFSDTRFRSVLISGAVSVAFNGVAGSSQALTGTSSYTGTTTVRKWSLLIRLAHQSCQPRPGADNRFIPFGSRGNSPDLHAGLFFQESKIRLGPFG